tara:strand:+ start:3380 stop:4210 length:831 start_codon:yes stop_codon:yes gene_type:complete
MFKNHFPRKKFGQHWLKDENVLNKIITSSELCSEDYVLEIGPGKGALTDKLLKTKIKGLHAIEIDRNLIDGLRNRFKSHSNFSLQEGDVLNIKVETPNNEGINKVVANIPYNITGPILEKFIGKLGSEFTCSYKKLVFLMQKEVADRIIAKEGSKNFSALSIKIQLIADLKKVCDVDSKSFSPAPKVRSSVLSFTPKNNIDRETIEIEKLIGKLLNISFREKRKKLRNTLGSIFDENKFEILRNCSGVDFDLRPQQLTILEWISLAKCCESLSLQK